MLTLGHPREGGRNFEKDHSPPESSFTFLPLLIVGTAFAGLNAQKESEASE